MWYNTKMDYKKFIIILVLVGILLAGMSVGGVQAFAQKNDETRFGEHGFGFGLWHGLLAPWSLIARLFIGDTVMYFIPNSGFVIGTILSIPIGWIAAIVSSAFHIFVY